MAGRVDELSGTRMNDSIELALALAILAVAAWPCLRVCVSGEFRRAFPRQVLAAWVALAIYVLVVLVMAVAWPGGLRLLAIVALACIVAHAIYSHPRFGLRRGLPPGSLKLLALAPWFERWFFLKQHRRYGSPFKVSQFIKPMACVVGLAKGHDLFRVHEDSLASPPLWFGRFIPGGLMRHMPPADHEAYRNILRDAFRPEAFQPLESFMTETMRSAMVAMARESAASGAAGIRPRPHIQRMMFVIWARLFFSVSADSADFARLKSCFRVIDTRNPQGASDERTREALKEIGEILQRQAADLRAQQGDAPGVLASIVRRQPAAVGDPTAMGNLIYEAHITWADLSGFLMWLLRMLTDHPEWSVRLRDDVASASDGTQSSPAALFVSETLRMEQSEHLYRVAEQDIEYDGIRIPRGWLVRLCVQESHRNPEVFADPDTFDPNRFRGCSYSRREYSPFGIGRHACIGEAIARTVGRLFVEEVGRSWQIKTVQDGSVEYSSWRHWRPSSRWRVLMTEKSGAPPATVP